MCRGELQLCASVGSDLQSSVDNAKPLLHEISACVREPSGKVNDALLARPFGGWAVAMGKGCVVGGDALYFPNCDVALIQHFQ